MEPQSLGRRNRKKIGQEVRKEIKTMKYGNVTLGQVEAAINKLGGQEIWDAWLRGEKTVTIEDAIRLIFDKHGNRIPPKDLKANTCNPDRSFKLNWPELDEKVSFVNRISRLHECLNIDTKVTAEQLKAETERLLAIIKGNHQIANIANGIYLPVVMPRLVTDDIGAELELYLSGVGKSYQKTFSDRSFNNYRKGDLSGKVNIVDGSRHDQLISRMKEGPVIGLHFPGCLQGYSILADREQMSTLPKGFILSGVDTAISMIMYTDVLARDWNIPDLDLTALSWGSADYSLYFEAFGGRLHFGSTVYLSLASDYCSGSLLFLG